MLNPEPNFQLVANIEQVLLINSDEFVLVCFKLPKLAFFLYLFFLGFGFFF